MLGNMLKKIRKDKQITKISVARATGINVGHITHIEKGERFPSHKALKAICKQIDVPYSLLSTLYDKKITEEQERYEVLRHLSYNSVPVVSSIDEFIECTSKQLNASFAIKVTDDTMSPTLEKGSYAYIELNVPLDNKDIGIFRYNNKTLIRRFIIRKDKLVLRADNKAYSDIDLNERDDFIIIGKVCNNT